MPRNVISEHTVDYDNCVGNFLSEKKTPEKLIEEEIHFWMHVKKKIHAETEGLPRGNRQLSSFSARQSKDSDDFNAKKNQSTLSLGLYVQAAEYLDVTCNQFLLADVHGDLPCGTSFRLAVDPTYQGVHEGWYFDESKLSLIYGKIHRAASGNPDATVLLTAYDDRSDILNALYLFFTEHRDLLPEHAQLTLCQYERGSHELNYYPTIYGTDDSLGIDNDYKHTLEVLGVHIEFEAKNQILFKLSDIYALDPATVIRQLRTPAVTEENFVEEASALLLSLQSSKPTDSEAGKKRKTGTMLGSMIFVSDEQVNKEEQEKKQRKENALFDETRDSLQA
ncbi:MAG: hypothetical protein P1U61_03715 [Legionellaceae bacterium]|nr:hypothetical protein [Legionellaceae bacterium]